MPRLAGQAGLRTFRGSAGQSEEIGPDFTLLAFDVDDATVAAFERAAARHNVPLRIVRDSYADGRTAYEAKLILVRPDQFIAWCGKAGRDNAGALLEKAAGLS